MSAAMAPRGPDGAGLWAKDGAGLGHRRLSVIDLSEAGAQPMLDPQLGLAVAFNGCIYNYKELRKELAADGYSFTSTSDTEVLLKAYHRWGERFRRAPVRDVRLRHRRASFGSRGHRARPAGHQADVSRRRRERHAPPGQHAARPARGGRRRRVDRPRRAAPLPQLARGRPRP